MITLAEFWEELNKHDWYYIFSDDGGVYRRGDLDRDRLEELANQSPEHQKLLADFRKHYFTGEPWNTEQAPKPPKPE